MKIFYVTSKRLVKSGIKSHTSPLTCTTVFRCSLIYYFNRIFPCNAYLLAPSKSQRFSRLWCLWRVGQNMPCAICQVNRQCFLFQCGTVQAFWYGTRSWRGLHKRLISNSMGSVKSFAFRVPRQNHKSKITNMIVLHIRFSIVIFFRHNSQN